MAVSSNVGRMNRSTLKLSDAARHVCVPSGIVTTGFPAVKTQLAKLNISFDCWQAGLGSLILSKRKDGMYAASIGGVVISIPRQTGKTYTVGWIIFALCIMHSSMTVIWTAHRTRTASETFQQMRTMARSPKVFPLVEATRAANGEQAVIFKNGSRILFGAREQGFGRGFAKVDILVFDEGQILTEDAMSDMVPATNAAPNGLVLLMGTPPRPKDPGEVFSSRRAEALEGDEDTLYVEFSADPEVDISSWPAGKVDWEQVKIANPSFPHRTSKTAILRLRKLLGSDDSFRREALGVWDTEGSSRLISQSEWDACIADPPESGIKSFGVAFSMDGSRQALAGAMKHANGVHVNLIDALSSGSEMSISALADWLAERKDSTALIAISGQAWSAVLVDALLQRGVGKRMIHVLTTLEVTASASMLLDAVRECTLTHPRMPPDATLERSVAVCDKKERGKSGGWSFESTSPDGDETPIEAVSFALWAARTTKRNPNRKQVIW
jgi:Terminase-like family.